MMWKYIARSTRSINTVEPAVPLSLPLFTFFRRFMDNVQQALALFGVLDWLCVHFSQAHLVPHPMFSLQHPRFLPSAFRFRMLFTSGLPIKPAILIFETVETFRIVQMDPTLLHWLRHSIQGIVLHVCPPPLFFQVKARSQFRSHSISIRLPSHLPCPVDTRGLISG